MILVDEAYHHYVESPDYESVIPLIKDHPNLIVARTFSKIYGMAGMRCGYAIAQPATIERMQPHQLNDGVSILSLVAASTSLADADHVPQARKQNSETRKFVLDALAKDGLESIASHANFIMVDLKRPVVPVIAAMKERKVKIGRLFPTLPNHMRLTIGKESGDGNVPRRLPRSDGLTGADDSRFQRRLVLILREERWNFFERNLALDQQMRRHRAIVQKFQRLPHITRSVMENAEERNLVVVNPVRIEFRLRAGGATTEQTNASAFAHHPHAHRPRLRFPHGLNHTIGATILFRASAHCGNTIGFLRSDR